MESKFYSNTKTPPHIRSLVGSFWWKDIIKLFDKFQSFSVCNLSRGNTTLFWTRSWSGQNLKDTYPQLYYFTRKPKCSIRYFLGQEVDRIFRLPLSSQAARQLEEIEYIVTGGKRLGWKCSDTWSYSWGNSKFSSRKAYNILIGNSEASPLFSWLQASCNLGKHKFFFRLLIRDRLNTRNLLRRKNMELDDYNCVMCNGGHEETSFHLFFECGFSQSCWNSIPIHWNMNLSKL